jgi:hypothetical protein
MKNVAYTVFLISFLGISNPNFSMNIAQGALSTVTTTLKWTLAAGPLWRDAYLRSTLLTEKGKQEFLQKLECHKLPQEAAMLLTNGNPDVDVYYSGSLMDKRNMPAGAFDKTLIVGTFIPGETGWLSLQTAFDDPTSPDFTAYAGIGAHETCHAVHGDSNTKIIPLIVAPIATNYASSRLMEKIMPKKIAVSNARFAARCFGRIPAGALLTGVNTALLSPLLRFHEQRADDAVPVEHIDGVISVLKGTELIKEKQIQEIAELDPRLAAVIKTADSILASAYHPSFETRVARFEARKQAWQEQQERSIPPL